MSTDNRSSYSDKRPKQGKQVKEHSKKRTGGPAKETTRAKRSNNRFAVTFGSSPVEPLSKGQFKSTLPRSSSGPKKRPVDSSKPNYRAGGAKEPGFRPKRSGFESAEFKDGEQAAPKREYRDTPSPRTKLGSKKPAPAFRKKTGGAFNPDYRTAASKAPNFRSKRDVSGSTEFKRNDEAAPKREYKDVFSSKTRSDGKKPAPAFRAKTGGARKPASSFPSSAKTGGRKTSTPGVRHESFKAGQKKSGSKRPLGRSSS
jgi:hypothetical protein